MQNLLTHKNIKINFYIFTRFFLAQNDGKLNCWKHFSTYAYPFSKTISFDGHLHCCSPLPTSSLTNTQTILTWVYEATGTATLEDLYDVQLSSWRFLLSDILCISTTCNIKSIWRYFLQVFYRHIY